MADTPSPKRPSWFVTLRKRLKASPGEAAPDIDPADVIREREQAGDGLKRDQRDMILKVAHFDRLRVSDVMVPRTDIVSVDANDTLEEVARVFEETQHSRLPIVRDGLDNPMGMVHVKDVLAYLMPDETGAPRAKLTDRILPRIRRELLYVPPSMPLPVLLLQMRTKRVHLCLVVDEYGGTDGLATIEDLMEQIVGDIDDEHDDDEATSVVPRGPGRWDADAKVEIADFRDETGVDLTLEDREDEIDTLGGLVVALAGRVPVRGEIVRHPAGYDLEVTEADPRRIKTVRLLRIEPQPEGEGRA